MIHMDIFLSIVWSLALLYSLPTAFLFVIGLLDYRALRGKTPQLRQEAAQVMFNSWKWPHFVYYHVSKFFRDAYNDYKEIDKS